MKTSIKTLTTICTVIISLNVSAQRNHNGNQPQPSNTNPTSQNNSDDRHGWGHGHHGGGNWGSHVTVTFGGWPNYYNNYYGYGYNYYGNNYSVKRAARNSIRQSANIISQALNFSEWNDTYSPWLAKAIRHQQYAKQLYFWGDYAGALNHAERAGFLAWNTLSYFNNSYGYDDGFAGDGYPNPYSDPNNPYYRKGSSNNSNQSNSSSDEDFGYKKGSTEKQSNGVNSDKKETQNSTEQKLNKSELDSSLPQSKLSDKELLKTSAKDLDIE
ncbi:MAG TPA: hypothetical protein PKZ75_12255 [Bacteroidia bacterium]|nr:hypothetical protein [Bacteroidia bacterium]